MNSNALFRSMATRSETTLTLINRNIDLSRHASTNLEGHVLEMKRTLLNTGHAFLSPPCTRPHVRQAAPSGSRGPLPFGEYPNIPPRVPSRSFLTLATHDTSPNNIRSDKSANEVSASEGCSTRLQTGYPNQFSEAPTHSGPFGVLEQSSSFFPETYTLIERIPSSFIQVVSSYELKSSSECRTNLYELIYRESPRQWRRLSVAIDIHRSSSYWILPKLPTCRYATEWKALGTLPCTLYEKLQDRFSKTQGLDDDSSYVFSVRGQTLMEEESYKQQPSSSCRRDLLTYLDDLGCPRYFESQVSQLAMTENPGCFVSFVDKKLMFETKVLRDPPDLGLIYSIQVLCAMKGIPSFARSAGIVTNASGKCLKSLVMQKSTKDSAFMFDIILKNRQIPWTRREKWARQLVEALREVHSKGLVVGTLWMPGFSIIIDDFDCVQLRRFKSKFTTGYNYADLFCPPEFRHIRHLLPPEFRHVRHLPPSTADADCPDITLKADIFHLGLVLWCLAENVPSNHEISSICVREACDSKLQPSAWWQMQKDSILLPHLSKSVPGYFRHIVDLCRAEDPNDRAPAWKLLELFPSASASNYSRRPDRKSESIDLACLGRLYSVVRFCDLCFQNGQQVVFHCNVCGTGNFDICKACYDKDLHCSNKDHLLIELHRSPSSPWTASGTTNTTRYHSSTRVSGTRQVVEL